jgi:hypothetical protein
MRLHTSYAATICWTDVVNVSWRQDYRRRFLMHRWLISDVLWLGGLTSVRLLSFRAVPQLIIDYRAPCRYTLTREKLLSDTSPKACQIERATADWNENEEGSRGITHTRTITVESGALQSCDGISINDFHASGQVQDDRAIPSANGTLDPILPGRPGWTSFQGSVVTEISAGFRGHSREGSDHFLRPS